MRLLLVGATGLVGRQVLRLALADDRIEHVIAPTRKRLPPHEKLFNPQVDFEVLPAENDWWQVDAMVCTLGTTIKKAGSQTAFRKVDFEYPLAVARLALAGCAKSCAVVSSAGANTMSGNFYLRVKGEMEREFSQLGFHSLTLVRPSLLGGERLEFRAGERAALLLLRLLGPLIPRRYRIVSAESVAARLLDAVIQRCSGTHIVESAQIGP